MNPLKRQKTSTSSFTSTYASAPTIATPQPVHFASRSIYLLQRIDTDYSYRHSRYSDPSTHTLLGAYWTAAAANKAAKYEGKEFKDDSDDEMGYGWGREDRLMVEDYDEQKEGGLVRITVNFCRGKTIVFQVEKVTVQAGWENESEDDEDDSDDENDSDDEDQEEEEYEDNEDDLDDEDQEEEEYEGDEATDESARMEGQHTIPRTSKSENDGKVRDLNSPYNATGIGTSTNPIVISDQTDASLEPVATIATTLEVSREADKPKLPPLGADITHPAQTPMALTAAPDSVSAQTLAPLCYPSVFVVFKHPFDLAQLYHDRHTPPSRISEPRVVAIFSSADASRIYMQKELDSLEAIVEATSAGHAKGGENGNMGGCSGIASGVGVVKAGITIRYSECGDGLVSDEKGGQIIGKGEIEFGGSTDAAGKQVWLWVEKWLVDKMLQG